jgi:TPP-dependent pyruvate/acetoin dehydrogenase alpha subunit
MNLHAAAGKAIADIRDGQGPILLECQCYRMKEHVGPGHDFHLGYRDETESAPWIENDALLQLREMLPPDVCETIHAGAEARVAEAIDFAETSPWPEPEDLMRGVYKVGG